MAINLPDNPTNGQEVTVGQGKLIYNTSKGVWQHFSTASAAQGQGGASVTVSDTAPSNPSSGDQWFDSSTGALLVYYTDADSSQWVGVTGTQGPAGTQGQAGTSVTAYANLAAFPSSGNTVGDFGFANDTKAVYIWDGTEWDRINAGPDALPDFTTDPSSSYSLATDGTTTTITTAASDPDGFPVTWDYDTNPSNQSQATVANNNDGTFVLTPSVNASDAGTFTFRVKASDGVHMATRSSSVELSFGMGNVYGFSITQTSYNYGHTNFTGIAIGQLENGTIGNIWEDANFRNSATFSSTSWGEGILSRDHTYDGGFFATQANTSYGITLPNPMNTMYWSESAANQTVSVTWTSPKTIQGVMVSGDASNNVDYWTGGYLQLYIGSASNLVATQYPLAGLNAFHNFMV